LPGNLHGSAAQLKEAAAAPYAADGSMIAPSRMRMWRLA